MIERTAGKALMIKVFAATLLLTVSIVTAGPSANFQGLGDLPGGQFRSRGTAVSADGSIVVGRSISNEAFIWDTENGMRSLEDVLVAEYGLDLSEWVLGEATD